MKLTEVPLEKLIIDPQNARAHGKRNLETVGGSLDAFGQVENLVVQKSSMRVIGGNGRLQVMRDRGDKSAHVLLLDIDDTRAKKLALALNRSAELASWDLDQLDETLRMLKSEQVDVTDIGFTPDEIVNIFGVKPEDKPEDTDTSAKMSDTLTYSVVVETDGEEAQQEILSEMEGRGFKCRLLIA